MTEFNRYALLMEAYTELKPELETTRHAKPVPALPALSEVLAEFGPLPREALFLGVASDGLPVLLNLHDPIPGPLLIIGDAGTGKTALLQSIARGTGKTHRPEDLQFGTLTNHPDEWNEINDIPNNVGTFPLYHKSADDFILSLAAWAHENKSSKQTVLLFMDDLESVSSLDFDTVQNLRWLLFRGPARRVWPIITLNSQHVNKMEHWLEIFRTRILGNIQDANHVRKLTSESADLSSLMAGTEFAMLEGNNWLRFWIPSNGE